MYYFRFFHWTLLASLLLKGLFCNVFKFSRDENEMVLVSSNGPYLRLSKPPEQISLANNTNKLPVINTPAVYKYIDYDKDKEACLRQLLIWKMRR